MNIPDDMFYIVELKRDNKVMVVVSMLLPIVGEKKLVMKHMGKKCDNSEKAILETQAWLKGKYKKALTGETTQQGKANPKYFQVDTSRLEEITFDLVESK